MRLPKGESQDRSRQIARAYDRGEGTMDQLAERYQVARNTVHRAVLRYGSARATIMRADDTLAIAAARAVVAVWQTPTRDAHQRAKRIGGAIARLQKALEEEGHAERRP